MGAAEEAVVQAALERGYVSAGQLEEARRLAAQAGGPGGLLGVLSERYLQPDQREALRALWREASGQEATRADGSASRHALPSGAGPIDPQTLPPPGVSPASEETLPPPGQQRFDAAGETLAEGGSGDPAGFDAAGVTFDTGSRPTAPPGPPGPPPALPEVVAPDYDPMAATLLEPGVITGPVPSPHDDFRGAHTLVEGSPPVEDDFRDAHTLVEPPPGTPGQAGPGLGPRGTVRAEQTEVARRVGEGHTKADDPRSGAPLSGVSPSLMSQTATRGRQRPAKTLPERIGGYKPVRELGRGGMGVVYEALDAADRPVALKVLLGGVSASEQAVQRFLVEGKATARMKHPHIVELYYLSERADEEGRWYLAMELVRGSSLKERVDKSGPLEEAAAVQLTIKLADALAYAHGRSVLHRDIKPHNVLLSEAGEPKLTDFGLAKLVGDQAHHLTASGPSVMGTPGFMPPEQAGASTQPADQRADVYSLGATLFHMLTGRPPFQDDSVARVLMAVVKSPPPLISSFRPDVSRDLETIVLKCLEKRPEDRYQTALELKSDLERFLGQQEIVATRLGALTRASRWVAANPGPAFGSFLVGAALVVLGGLQVRQALQPPPVIPPTPPIYRPPVDPEDPYRDPAWVGSGLRPLGIGPVTTGSEIARIDTASLDTMIPTLIPRLPAPGSYVSEREVVIKVEARDDSGTVEVTLNGEPLALDPLVSSGDVFVGTWLLEGEDGEKQATISAVDTSGNPTTATLSVILDRAPPALEVTQEPAGVDVVVDRVVVRVRTSEPAEVSTDDGRTVTSDERKLVHTVALKLELDQPVEFELTARDLAGNKGRTTHRVMRVLQPWLRGTWAGWKPHPAQLAAAGPDRPLCFENKKYGMRFALVPAGEFERGWDGLSNAFRRVRLSAPYYVSATELTNAQARALLGSRTSGGGELDEDDHPAVGLSWEDAVEVCRRLNLDKDGYEYSLPTDAEWEHACLALTPGWWASVPAQAIEAGVDKPTATARVATRPANPFGLFDLLGNAEEWCLDRFIKLGPEGQPPLVDPVAVEAGVREWVAGGAAPGSLEERRVLRGGSWKRKREQCVPGKERAGWKRTDADSGIGLRLVARRSGS